MAGGNEQSAVVAARREARLRADRRTGVLPAVRAVVAPNADKWADRFSRFAELECRGLSPLYETVSLGIARDAELLEWIANVIGSRAHPTLLFAAVHYLLLDGAKREGERLADFYPNLTEAGAPSTAVYPAFRAFVDRKREQLAPLLAERVTQTNEVGRCTYLLPAFVLAAIRCDRPLWVIDVGASAGMNLLFDRYAYDYGNGTRAGDMSSAVRLRTEVRGRPCGDGADAADCRPCRRRPVADRSRRRDGHPLARGVHVARARRTLPESACGTRYRASRATSRRERERGRRCCLRSSPKPIATRRSSS